MVERLLNPFLADIDPRSWRCTLAGLLLVGSSPAFARGGPGDALGSVLETMLAAAIVLGLIAGISCALVLRRTPWRSMVLVASATFAISIAFPFAGILSGLACLVTLAVFASAFHVARGGFLRARENLPSPGANEAITVGAGERAPDVLRWIAVTYLFWAVASLANLELLGFLAIAPIVLVSSDTIYRFLPFVAPPLAVAGLVAAGVTTLWVRRRSSRRRVAPIFFNACLLVCFLLSAEIFRSHLMAKSLRGHTPENLQKSIFLTSVLVYRRYTREPHGGFEENGDTYRWSYAHRKFVRRSRVDAAPEIMNAN